MCFSPIASFAASSFLAFVSGAAIETVVVKKKINYIFLAATPLLFAIQQFIEGLSWLCLQYQDTGSCGIPTTVSYLIFVGIIWPIWFPIAVLQVEKNKLRKNLLFLILLVGAGIASFNFYYLLSYEIIPKIINHSIYYTSWFPQILIYGPVIFLPFIISSRPYFWMIGILIALAILVTYFYFEKTGCSVWCFFSAVISSILYLSLRHSYFANETEFIQEPNY